MFSSNRSGGIFRICATHSFTIEWAVLPTTAKFAVHLTLPEPTVLLRRSLLECFHSKATRSNQFFVNRKHICLRGPFTDYCPARFSSPSGFRKEKDALNMLKLIAYYIQIIRDVPNVCNLIESIRRSTNLETPIIYYLKFAWRVQTLFKLIQSWNRTNWIDRKTYGNNVHKIFPNNNKLLRLILILNEERLLRQQTANIFNTKFFTFPRPNYYLSERQAIFFLQSRTSNILHGWRFFR
jgi:hypothetical protein